MNILLIDYLEKNTQISRINFEFGTLTPNGSFSRVEKEVTRTNVLQKENTKDGLEVIAYYIYSTLTELIGSEYSIEALSRFLHKK